MRRYLIVIPLLISTLACQVVTRRFFVTPTATAAPTLTSQAASSTFFLPPSASLASSDTKGTFTVRFHPDGDLYVGDQVSFEVIPPADFPSEGRRVIIQVDSQAGVLLGPAEFGRFGIGGRLQATLDWAWDTRDLAPGLHFLTFIIEPDGPLWIEAVNLLPQSALPLVEAQARWARAESHCCVVYYITDTEAERDLPQLLNLADQQAQAAEQHLQTQAPEPIPLVLLARVLGHGGFTNQAIAVSYLDRRYSGGDLGIILHHEMIHWLDARLGGRFRPTLLVEGLAVYLSGGHFKAEALAARAATLPGLGLYLPLKPLADRFYPSQHEVGYLEAGALVEYMVGRWGWEAFARFYRNIPERPSQAEAIDAALRQHFGLTFSELESDFLEYLSQQHPTPAQRDDVRLTVRFYDTVRRYQQMLDPSAYYLTTWLPDSETMRQRGIVADYLRHPTAPENLALENLLVSADSYLRQGGYAEAEVLIQAVNHALDAMPQVALP